MLRTSQAGCGARMHPFATHKTKPPQGILAGVLSNKSLTMTYFHRRPSTIIGAKAFHCPVRDGKEWDHLAMVVKRKLVAESSFKGRPSQLEEAPCCDQYGSISKCLRRCRARVALHFNITFCGQQLNSLQPQGL